MKHLDFLQLRKRSVEMAVPYKLVETDKVDDLAPGTQIAVKRPLRFTSFVAVLLSSVQSRWVLLSSWRVFGRV